MATDGGNLYFSNFHEACEVAKQNPGSITKRSDTGNGFMVILKTPTVNHTSVARYNDYNYRKQNDVPVAANDLDDIVPF